jgi:hypothetical protein
MTSRLQLNGIAISIESLFAVERRTIVCRTPNDCLSNAERLFAERRTIVCRTSNDWLSNVERLFVERRKICDLYG